MALVAVHENNKEEVESFAVSPDRWNVMRKEPKGSYVMPGTGWPAVLKRSIRGTQFFAYAPGFTGVKPEPESEEHRVIKIAIAQVLRNAGHPAEVERSGNSPDGEAWQADVLCDVRGQKIAFEVQLSRQTLEEYERRSDVYKKSGITPIWLVKHHGALVKAVCYRLRKSGVSRMGYGHAQTVPFVYLTIEKEKPFSLDRAHVQIAYRAENLLRQLSISDFAVALASGSFEFVEIEQTLIDGTRNKCWRWQLNG